MPALLLSVFITAAALAADPPAAVVAADAAERRTAPHGKASITILAQGVNAFLGRLELAPGAQVPRHRDATEEYVHVLSGSGTITIDGVAQAVGPGTTVYMPANVEVSYTNGEEQLVAIQVFAGPGPAQKYDGWKAP